MAINFPDFRHGTVNFGLPQFISKLEAAPRPVCFVCGGNYRTKEKLINHFKKKHWSSESVIKLGRHYVIECRCEEGSLAPYSNWHHHCPYCALRVTFRTKAATAYHVWKFHEVSPCHIEFHGIKFCSSMPERWISNSVRLDEKCSNHSPPVTVKAVEDKPNDNSRNKITVSMKRKREENLTSTYSKKHAFSKSVEPEVISLDDDDEPQPRQAAASSASLLQSDIISKPVEEVGQLNTTEKKLLLLYCKRQNKPIPDELADIDTGNLESTNISSNDHSTETADDFTEIYNQESTSNSERESGKQTDQEVGSSRTIYVNGRVTSVGFILQKIQELNKRKMLSDFFARVGKSDPKLIRPPFVDLNKTVLNNYSHHLENASRENSSYGDSPTLLCEEGGVDSDIEIIDEDTALSDPVPKDQNCIRNCESSSKSLSIKPMSSLVEPGVVFVDDTESTSQVDSLPNLSEQNKEDIYIASANEVAFKRPFCSQGKYQPTSKTSSEIVNASSAQLPDSKITDISFGLKMPNNFICKNIFKIYLLCAERSKHAFNFCKFLYNNKLQVVAKCCSKKSKRSGIKCVRFDLDYNLNADHVCLENRLWYLLLIVSKCKGGNANKQIGGKLQYIWVKERLSNILKLCDRSCVKMKKLNKNSLNVEFGREQGIDLVSIAKARVSLISDESISNSVKDLSYVKLHHPFTTITSDSSEQLASANKVVFKPALPSSQASKFQNPLTHSVRYQYNSVTNHQSFPIPTKYRSTVSHEILENLRKNNTPMINGNPKAVSSFPHAQNGSSLLSTCSVTTVSNTALPNNSINTHANSATRTLLVPANASGNTANLIKYPTIQGQTVGTSSALPISYAIPPISQPSVQYSSAPVISYTLASPGTSIVNSSVMTSFRTHVMPNGTGAPAPILPYEANITNQPNVPSIVSALPQGCVMVAGGNLASTASLVSPNIPFIVQGPTANPTNLSQLVAPLAPRIPLVIRSAVPVTKAVVIPAAVPNYRSPVFIPNLTPSHAVSNSTMPMYSASHTGSSQGLLNPQPALMNANNCIFAVPVSMNASNSNAMGISSNCNNTIRLNNISGNETIALKSIKIPRNKNVEPRENSATPEVSIPLQKNVSTSHYSDCHIVAQANGSGLCNSVLEDFIPPMLVKCELAKQKLFHSPHGGQLEEHYHFEYSDEEDMEIDSNLPSACSDFEGFESSSPGISALSTLNVLFTKKTNLLQDEEASSTISIDESDRRLSSEGEKSDADLVIDEEKDKSVLKDVNCLEEKNNLSAVVDEDKVMNSSVLKHANSDEKSDAGLIGENKENESKSVTNDTNSSDELLESKSSSIAVTEELGPSNSKNSIEARPNRVTLKFARPVNSSKRSTILHQLRARCEVPLKRLRGDAYHYKLICHKNRLRNSTFTRMAKLMREWIDAENFRKKKLSQEQGERLLNCYSRRQNQFLKLYLLGEFQPEPDDWSMEDAKTWHQILVNIKDSPSYKRLLIDQLMHDFKNINNRLVQSLLSKLAAIENGVLNFPLTTQQEIQISLNAGVNAMQSKESNLLESIFQTNRVAMTVKTGERRPSQFYLHLPYNPYRFKAPLNIHDYLQILSITCDPDDFFPHSLFGDSGETCIYLVKPLNSSKQNNFETGSSQSSLSNSSSSDPTSPFFNASSISYDDLIIKKGDQSVRLPIKTSYQRIIVAHFIVLRMLAQNSNIPYRKQVTAALESDLGNVVRDSANYEERVMSRLNEVKVLEKKAKECLCRITSLCDSGKKDMVLIPSEVVKGCHPTVQTLLRDLISEDISVGGNDERKAFVSSILNEDHLYAKLSKNIVYEKKVVNYIQSRHASVQDNFKKIGNQIIVYATSEMKLHPKIPNWDPQTRIEQITNRLIQMTNAHMPLLSVPSNWESLTIIGDEFKYTRLKVGETGTFKVLVKNESGKKEKKEVSVTRLSGLQHINLHLDEALKSLEKNNAMSPVIVGNTGVIFSPPVIDVGPTFFSHLSAIVPVVKESANPPDSASETEKDNRTDFPGGKNEENKHNAETVASSESSCEKSEVKPIICSEKNSLDEEVKPVQNGIQTLPSSESKTLQENKLNNSMQIDSQVDDVEKDSTKISVSEENCDKEELLTDALTSSGTNTIKNSSNSEKSQASRGNENENKTLNNEQTNSVVLEKNEARFNISSVQEKDSSETLNIPSVKDQGTEDKKDSEECKVVGGVNKNTATDNKIVYYMTKPMILPLTTYQYSSFLQLASGAPTNNQNLYSTTLGSGNYSTTPQTYSYVSTSNSKFNSVATGVTSNLVINPPIAYDSTVDKNKSSPLGLSSFVQNSNVNSNSFSSSSTAQNSSKLMDPMSSSNQKQQSMLDDNNPSSSLQNTRISPMTSRKNTEYIDVSDSDEENDLASNYSETTHLSTSEESDTFLLTDDEGSDPEVVFI